MRSSATSRRMVFFGLCFVPVGMLLLALFTLPAYYYLWLRIVVWGWAGIGVFGILVMWHSRGVPRSSPAGS
jgi:hypothetical protein